MVAIHIYKKLRLTRYDMSSSDSKKIKKLEERVSKLEKAVFGSQHPQPKNKDAPHKGLVGGINLLIENGFFNKPVLVTEVQDELQKEGYYHPIQSTDTMLRRNMVNRKKILTRLKVDGIWQYVLRK